MSAPRIEKWLLIDVKEFLAATHHLSVAEIGECWLGGLRSVQGGQAPDLPGVRVKQRVGNRSLPSAVRAAVFKRDGAICRYCCDRDGPFQVDHVLAVARGGSDDLTNLTVACETCNRSKGAKLLSEWGQ